MADALSSGHTADAAKRGLEYHHVLPFAAGGATDAANVELRCRAHNAYEATVWFGEEDRHGARAGRCADASTLFEQS